MIATFFIVFAYVQSSIGEEVGSMMDMLMATAGLPSMQAIGKALAVTAVGMFIQIAVFVSAVFFAVTVANVRPFQRFGILTALAVFFSDLYCDAGSSICGDHLHPVDRCD